MTAPMNGNLTEIQSGYLHNVLATITWPVVLQALSQCKKQQLAINMQ